MFNFKKFGVAAVVALSAVGAMASNFRAADQVYVPAAGHLAGSSGTFISDIFISNLSDDAVDVSVIYSAGQTGTQQRFNNVLHLAARERREIVDFFPTTLNLSSGFGQLVFNACLANADCTAATQDQTGFSPNFRNISVESRIYSIPAGASLSSNPPTTGQLFSGIPWYFFVSSDAAANGLDSVFITGVRNTGGTGQAGSYRSNIGLVNASQYSNTTLVAKLFDGKTGTQIGSEYDINLGPLGAAQVNVTTAFPTFVGTTATNAYVTVSQKNTTATSDAPAGCQPGGCPGFFAYGSVLDNVSGDATTLEPQFTKALSDAAIGQIFGSSSGKNIIHRIVAH